MQSQAPTDPYNYPFLQKTETMYLSTISTSYLIQAKWISSPPTPIMQGTPLSNDMTSKALTPK